MKTVVFLQNAWSPVYAGGTWPRRSWLAALKACRSGQRLRQLLDRDDVWFDNTTPIVGETASSIVAPDFEHIRKVLRTQQPAQVIACGKQAGEALTGLFTPLLITPHPAYRVVTNELWTEVAMLTQFGFKGRMTLEQGRGKIIRRVE